jgi:hypothetical protein
VVEPAVLLGVAPAQIGVEDLAGQIVRNETARPLLDEGESSQPGEERLGVLAGESSGQRRLGQNSDVGAGVERQAVGRRRHVFDEALEQRGRRPARRPAPVPPGRRPEPARRR